MKGNPAPTATIEEMETWPELITIKQASILLNTPARTVNTLCNKGKLPCCRIGNNWKLPRRRLMALAGLAEGEP